MKFHISNNIFQRQAFKGISYRDCLGIDGADRLYYAIPNQAKGGGNTSTASNVFRVSFSNPLSTAPLYEMWDNGTTYPGVDAAGATTAKEAFTGTTDNSSIPEYSLIATTSSAPTSNWQPSSATGGSANPNRMLGSTNYVTDPTTPTNVAAPVVSGTSGAGSSGGSLTASSTYKYEITYVVGTSGLPIGETLVSAAITATTAGGQGTITLSSIPTGGAGVIYRNIYRTQAGGSSYTFDHQIADNTTTSYADTSSDASIVGNASPSSTDTSASIRFNMTASFGADSTVPSSSSQNILLQIQYQYTGSAPSLSYYYNDATAGTDSAPTWIALTPGTDGVRFVNAGTVSGTYKFTLPASGVSSGVTDLWVTAT